MLKRVNIKNGGNKDIFPLSGVKKMFMLLLEIQSRHSRTQTVRQTGEFHSPSYPIVSVTPLLMGSDFTAQPPPHAVKQPRKGQVQEGKVRRDAEAGQSSKDLKSLL